MRHRVRSVKLGRKKDHLKSLLRNLVTSLVLHGHIQTTEKKAKAIQGMVDKLITTVKKKEEREAIRELRKVLFTKESSEKMVQDLKKRYKDRNSGFTRIIPLGVREGDGASKVQIELIL